MMTSRDRFVGRESVVKVLVIDIDGSSLKVLSTGRRILLEIPSGSRDDTEADGASRARLPGGTRAGGNGPAFTGSYRLGRES